MITEILLIIFCIASYYFIKRTSRPPNFPPGPSPWPLVGNMLVIMKKQPLQVTLKQLSEKYGGMFGMMFGNLPVLSVNDYDTVKEICARDDCTGRPDGILLRARSFHKRLGVLFSEGTLWKEQRRFTLRHLRDFGFGKTSLEGLMHEEIAELLERIEKRAKESDPEQGMIINDMFPVSVINVLWAIMAGKRHEHDDKDFLQLMDHVNAFFRHGSPTGGLMIMPILRFVPIINSGYKKQISSVHALQSYVMNTINEHENDFQPDNARDFIDVFLSEMKLQKDVPKTTFTKEQLVVLCMDLFLAGTETTSSNLAYLILFLMINPEVQEKARTEIHEVVGKDRLPALADLPSLQYIQALFHELLRFASVVAMTPPHFTRNKINFRGFDIPKRTLILVNIYSVLTDKVYWKDPENFRPERFLDENGKFVKNERVIAFGTGPRFCLGEPLARNSSFLFGTALMQRFRFSLPKSAPYPSFDHLQGFTTAPRPFHVTVTTN